MKYFLIHGVWRMTHEFEIPSLVWYIQPTGNLPSVPLTEKVVAE